jgi:hypothetical protein
MVVSLSHVLIAMACVLAVAAAAEGDYPACRGGQCASANSWVEVNGVKYCCYQGSIRSFNNDVYCSAQQYCPPGEAPILNGTVKAVSGVGTCACRGIEQREDRRQSLVLAPSTTPTRVF